MKQKLNKIYKKMQNDDKLKKVADSIRPQRTIWGIIGTVVFFFIPEIVVYIWQSELVNWAHSRSITEPIALSRMLYVQLEEMFASGVSWVNIGIGIVLLVWMWRSK